MLKFEHNQYDQLALTNAILGIFAWWKDESLVAMYGLIMACLSVFLLFSIMYRDYLQAKLDKFDPNKDDA